MKLLPTQETDSGLMVKRGHALNYSAPGCGKTLTAIEAVMLEGLQGGIVLAPPIALRMWKEVIEEHTGMTCDLLNSGRSPKNGGDWIVTTYALAASSQFEHLYENGEGRALILDEAHACKTAASKRTKAVFGPANTGRGGLFDPVERTYSLTGTPILRHADDLWSQLRATKPDILREYGVESYERFVATFCFSQVKQFHPRQRPQRTVVGSRNDELLKKLLADCGVIRRTMDEVASDMPPVTVRTIDFGKSKVKAPKLSQAQIAAGLAAEDEVLIKVWREMGEEKVDLAADYIAEACSQGPVLAGYWFTDNGEALAENLRRRKLFVGVVRGGVSEDERESIRLAFNAGALDCIVGQMSAMGVSWNLQKSSSHVVIVEDHFSPGIIEQFYKRVARYGQKSHVQVDFLKFDNDLEKAIVGSRERKAGFTEKVL